LSPGGGDTVGVGVLVWGGGGVLDGGGWGSGWGGGVVGGGGMSLWMIKS